QADPIRPHSSAGCGVGHMCAIARRPSAPCSRGSQPVSRRLCWPMPCSRPRPSACSPTPGTRSTSSTRRLSASTWSAGSTRRLCCRLSSARWWRPVAPRNRPRGVSLLISLRCVTKEPANCRNCSLPAAACVAGRTTRRSLASCSVTIRPRLLTRSRRRSAQARRLPTLADRLPTRRRSAWRASAMPTSTPIGKRRTTSSPMPMRSTRCSSGSGAPVPTGHGAAVRGVLHGAMALYLTRYLNVPPARIPGEGGDQLDELPADAEMIRAALLDAFDRQRQVDLAARLVARHLTLGHSPQALIATLARALLREDAGFHAYQMLEAGVRQSAAWGDTGEGRHILIAVARYLAAHSPTERAALQT